MEKQDIRGLLNGEYLEILKTSFLSSKGKNILTNAKKRKQYHYALQEQNTLLPVLRCFHIINIAGSRANVTIIDWVLTSMFI